MKPKPRISETEWELMRVLWAEHPLSATEVVDRLNARDPGWHPKTVRTLLSRLVAKKALRPELRGRVYYYHPLAAERDCVAAASELFLERVFGGVLKPMLAHFVEQRKITKKELKELQDLLEGKGGNA